MANFYGQKQSTHESSETFVNTKIRLSSKLFPHYSEEEIINNLMQLLHSSVRVHLLQTPATLDELFQKLEVIDEYRNVNNKFPGEQRRKEPHTSPKSETTKLNSFPSAQTTRFQKSSYPYNPQSDKKTFTFEPSFLPKCNYCNDKHYHKDCPVLLNKRQALSKSQPSPLAIKSTPSDKFNTPPPPFKNNLNSNQRTNFLAHDKNHIGQIQIQEIPKALPSVRLQVGEYQMDAFVDSGANVNCLHVQILPEDITLKTNNIPKISVATTDVATTLGTTSVAFKLGSHTYIENFLVFDRLSAPAILGSPFLETQDGVLDYRRRKLILGTEYRDNIPFVLKPTDTTDPSAPSIDISQVNHEFPAEFQAKFQQIMNDYAPVFDTTVLQRTNAASLHIELTTSKPIYTPPRPLSKTKVEYLEKQVKEMLHQNIIEPSESPYNSPVVIVEYKDNKEPRFCVDYSRINNE